MLVKNSADDILKHFLIFRQGIGFDISCKLSRRETFCMKLHQSLFSETNKTIIINLSSAELPQRVVKVKMLLGSYGNIISFLLTLVCYCLEPPQKCNHRGKCFLEQASVSGLDLHFFINT